MENVLTQVRVHDFPDKALGKAIPYPNACSSRFTERSLTRWGSESRRSALPTRRAAHRLFVIDGAAGLRRAITDVFGSRGVVQRCQVH